MIERAATKVADTASTTIVFTGGAPRQRLFRAGIDFKRGRMVVMDGPKEIAGCPIDLTVDRPVAITVQADTRRGGFAVAACGKTLQAKMPNHWTHITAYGYGLSNSTVEFSEIKAVAR